MFVSPLTLQQKASAAKALPLRQPVADTTAPRFGAAVSADTVTHLAEHAAHQLPALKTGGKLAKFLDPVDMFQSTWNQCKLVYAVCIGSRVYEGMKRSGDPNGKSLGDKLGNEGREVLSRDPFGWLIWFYAADMVQRLYTKAFVPKHFRDQMLTYPDKTANPFKRHNPLAWNFSTPTQLRQRHAYLMKNDPHYQQAMGQLDEARAKLAELKLGKAAAHEVQAAKQHLTTLYRKTPPLEMAAKLGDVVSFAGLGTSIALLGLGIPTLNILITKRNVFKKEDPPPAPQAT